MKEEPFSGHATVYATKTRLYTFLLYENQFTFDVYKNLLKYLNCWRIFFLTSLKKHKFSDFSLTLKDLFS